MARLTGKFGAVFIGSTPSKLADIFDWEFQATTDLLACDIKGDAYNRFVPSHTTARFTAKRRNEGTFLTLASYPQDAVINATQLLFRLDLVSGDTGFTQITGQGYVSAGSLNAPRDPVDDIFEVTFDGAYVITTGT